MTGTYTLVGFAHPKLDKAEALKTLLLSFVEPTRAEPGCLEHHFHIDKADPSVFVFYEVWRSKEDLDRHLELSHMKAFWDARMDYLKEDLDVRWVDMASPYPR